MTSAPSHRREGGRIDAENRMTDVATKLSYRGVYRNGAVEVLGAPPWTDGCHVHVELAAEAPEALPCHPELVIVAGFGLAGRWSVEVFDRFGIEYVIVEKNPVTVKLQEAIGRSVLLGDISDEDTLRAAGIERAGLLALAMPDEQAVLAAIRIARRINPNVYIIARTNFTSQGMEATRLGANAVIKAEEAVADRFYRLLMHRVGRARSAPEENSECRVANNE